MTVLKLVFVYKGVNKFFAHNPAESILGLQSLCMKPGKIIKELVMIDKSNEPKPTNIDATSSVVSTQQNIPDAEGAGENPLLFRVEASVNLTAAVEFIVKAANETEAKTKAAKSLDKADFNISSDFDVLDFCVSVNPECVQCEVLGDEQIWQMHLRASRP